MSIIQSIKSKLLFARKEKDKITTDILTALYSEVSIVGKNLGNRETTDKEAINVIKSFIKGINETINILKGKNKDVSNLNFEIEIYKSFLPPQLKEDELKTVIHDFILTLTEDLNKKSIGIIMKFLNENYEGRFEGSLANEIIQKEILLKQK